MDWGLVPTDAGYIHLYHQVGGRRGGELLLHQLPDSSHTWIPLVRELAPLPWVMADMLNLGESDATVRPLRLEKHAEYLWQAVQQVGRVPRLGFTRSWGLGVPCTVVPFTAEADSRRSC